MHNEVDMQCASPICGDGRLESIVKRNVGGRLLSGE
jgi:hypothetical protein